MKTLYFITSNKGKVQEATQKLRPLGFSVVQKNLGYPEIQADTLEEVALQGVSHVQAHFQKPFIKINNLSFFINGQYSIRR